MSATEQAIQRRRLKTRQAADYLGLGELTLEKYRVFGGGPAYQKLGRSVVYTVEELERWAEARTRQEHVAEDHGGGVMGTENETAALGGSRRRSIKSWRTFVLLGTSNMPAPSAGCKRAADRFIGGGFNGE